MLTNLVRVLDKHFGQKSTANHAIRYYSSQFEFPPKRKAKKPNSVRREAILVIMYRIKEKTRKLPKTVMRVFFFFFFPKNAQNFATWNLMVPL